MNLLNKILLRILSGLLLCGLLFNTATAQSVQIGEVGQQSGVNHNWMTVNLTGTYTDPIVVAKARNLVGSDISQPRVRNVTSNSFQVKVKDFDFEAQTRSAQTVSYMVVERGAWVLPNGQKIEAGDIAMTCCDVDANTTFSTQFDATPAVVVTPNTDRTQSVYYRVKDLTATSFNTRFTDADATGDPETLNWIAMEDGGDTTYGIAELITTTQGVDKTWVYGQTFAAGPQVFLSSRSYLDATPMTNRIRVSPNTTQVVFYQQAGTTDVYHPAAEDVSAIALPSGTVMGNSALSVTNTNDSGGGSLRSAIDFANANTTEDDIIFAIDGTGPHKIIMTSTPPSITDTGISIDGTTQTGASCGDLWNGTPHSLMIEVNAPSTLYSTMRIFGNSMTIKGLSLTGGTRGIFLDSGVSDTVIQCNYIGLTPDGVADGPNENAISVGGSNTLIGGSSVGQGNVIGGSTFSGLRTETGSAGTIIQGNFIGTDPLGTSSRANGNSGITHESGAGTWAEITGNLISGNTESGIAVSDNDSVTGVGGADVIIAGNYIGVDRTGNAALPNGDDGISFESGSISGVTIGGTATADRNIISGNGESGIQISGQSDISILGNYIGLGADGVTEIGNTEDGITLNTVTNINIGNGTLAGLNVISANSDDGIDMNTTTNVTIDTNYIGLAADGLTAKGNGSGIVALAPLSSNGHSNLEIIDNVISANNVGGINISATTFGSLGAASTISITGNFIGVAADGTTARGNVGTGVHSTNVPGVTIGGTGAADGNIIANNSDQGVSVSTHSQDTTILGNLIYGHTNLGIDIGGNSGDGVTDNDSGDADTGANGLINFPVIETFTASGATSVGYSVTLDVPANTEGYRIEFFKNSSPDTTNGEGEIFLGFVDTGDHTGGAIVYDGTFTASETVSVGDSISATTTRKTAATSYDITSEFAVNKTAQSALLVTNTNDSGAGSLRAAIDFANANTAEDNITFAIPGTGPFTISPTSALPSITDDGISIDGTTESGASCGQLTTGTPHTLMVRIDGLSAAGTAIGFNVAATNSSLRGLSITGFTSRGISITNSADNNLIECSYIGVEPDGETKGPNVRATNTPAINIGAITGGAIRNSLISGNDDDGTDLGIAVNGVTNFTLDGNIIGLNASGTTALPNGNYGVYLLGSNDNVTFGGITPETRNIISGNGADGIYVDSGSSNIDILGNYIGTDITGAVDLGNTADGIFLSGSTDVTIGGTTAADRNVISGNGESGIEASGNSNITILGNYIGVAANGTTNLGNSGKGVSLNGASDVEIGNAAGGGNIISGNSDAGIDVNNGSETIIQGNSIGLGADGITAIGNGGHGVLYREVSSGVIGGTTSGAANNIANNIADGVRLANAAVVILGNSIYSNGQQGVDDGGSSNDSAGVTDNDSPDTDGILNFPLINAVTAGGTTSVGYSVELDVPANTEGYRIEFFKNSSPDTTNGEGEIFLGFVDTGDHIGGAIDFDGTFTASENVSSGDSISATATRKTGALAYDITSEFAVNKTAQSALVVTNTNDSGAGSLRAAIDFANANPAEDNITFAIDGTGPHTITLASALPVVADAGIVIDGSTQTGATCGTLVTGTQHDLRIVINGNDLNINGLAVSATSTTIKGLSIVNTSPAGLQFTSSADNSVAECNYIGMETDGSTVNSVAKSGASDGAIDINGADSVTLHNNLISGSTGSSGDGIRLDQASVGTMVTGNIIGLDATGLLARPNRDVGIIIDEGSNGTIIGGTTATARNIISGNAVNAIRLRLNQSDVSILGNYFGLGRDGVTVIGNDSSGISVINISTNLKIGDGTAAGANYIVGNGAYGISITGSSTVSILGNVIFDNIGVGIDLGGNGVSANDSGDGDTGPNETLNFPVINDFASDGSTGMTYDINLDVPAADYRIDFYRNSAPHSTGYGEGEIHLGFVEFSHAGGDLQHTGAFTANSTVIQGNYISATTTRKTGTLTYDITSEFSLTTTTGTPTELTASKSVEVYDPTNAGLYSLPGNDVISSLTVTNPGSSPADADSIVIIDAIPAEVTFYNGDIDDGGAETNAVSFVQTGGANLTFTYLSDVKFSNSGIRPNDMSGCNYTPSAGYDTNVTFICLNPKGAMAAGNPDPTFTVAYRAKIK